MNNTEAETVDVTLLPCPFCGSGPAIPMTGALAGFSGVEVLREQRAALDDPVWSVWCGTCGATSVESLNEATAIAAWNSRTSQPIARAALNANTTPDSGQAAVPSREAVSTIIEDLVPACAEPWKDGVKEMRRAVMWRLYERILAASPTPSDTDSVREAIEALTAADEALRAYACHGGADIPCRRTPEQCASECGSAAGDAFVKVNAALAKLTEEAKS